ncbi:MAG: Matrixin [Pseudomonadota bacterium]|jgi:hypothetical protein
MRYQPVAARAGWLALLLLTSLPLAAETPPPAVALSWPERSYRWFYNPEGEPEWVAAAGGALWVRQQVESWSPCGFRLEYGGLTTLAVAEMDGANVVGWRDDGKDYSGWTRWRAYRDGRAIEADVVLYRNIFERYRQQGIDALLELKKTLIHEVGHVLGLTHSTVPGDAMTVKLRTRPEWVLPSANDLARCRARYPG